MNFRKADRGVQVSMERHGMKCEEYYSFGGEVPLADFFHAIFKSEGSRPYSWLSECQDLSFGFSPAEGDSKAVMRISMCIDKDDEHGAVEVAVAYDIELDDIQVDFAAMDKLLNEG
ncbi:hypothetical protein [Rubritalea halochordaticola]